METRELWERNSVLAEAFCASDDKVRRAQAVLDEAQADRTRMLAAFAVTVGSDGGVADLMGLNEREVRLARRTVGKDDARSVAKRLFKPGAQDAPDPRPETQPETEPEPRSEVQPGPEPEHAPGPVPEPEYASASPTAEIHLPHPRSEATFSGQSAGTYASYHVPAAEPVTWSPAMDSVLLWSWQSGLDLQTVAVELGLDTRELLLRAQTLAAEGRLAPKPMAASDPGQAGRHRRREEGLHVPVPDSPEGLYSFTPYG